MSTRFNTTNILDTIEMIENYRLDIRTVTMGISLIGCTRATMGATAQAVYDRVTARAAELDAIRSEGPVFNREGVDELVAACRREVYLSTVDAE